MMKTLLATLLLAAPLAAEEMPATLALKTAANAFLASLDEDKKAEATESFGSAERENWHFVPMVRKGLALKDMTEAQKNAAVALANAVLSEEGALKAAQVIQLEAILAQIEGDPEKRDPEKYYVMIFGKPGDHHGWGFRFEGHHLSINIAVIDDKISVTPSFLGSNPAEVREGEYKGLRVLAAEEDLARALAASLLETGHDEVVFTQKPPRDVVTGQDRVAERPKAVGVLASEMNESQREGLMKLLRTYAELYRDEIAAKEIEEIKKQGMDSIRFAWAGSIEPGKPYYYRVLGDSFLMEAANTQNNANHMHAVWREFDGDFGRDLLREHMEKHH